MSTTGQFVHPKIHNDEPRADGEVFNQEALAKRIADTLTHTEAPGIFGLHGDWGSGKTSLLYQVHEQLTGYTPLDEGQESTSSGLQPNPVIYFEAWRYQQESAPIVALLHEVASGLGKWAKFKNATAKLSEVTIRSFIMSVENIGEKLIPFASVLPKSSMIQKTGEEWEKRHHTTKLPTQTLRDLLNKAFSDLLQDVTKPQSEGTEGPAPRVIIIIDDLDRCQPLVAYKLLESIKIFLNIPSCVFLLGINREEVERSIAVGLKEESGISDAEEASVRKVRSQEYLEKLCGHIWALPFPSNKQCNAYLESLLVDSSEKNTIMAIYEVYEEKKQRLLPANPRRIKALANCLNDLTPSSKSAEPAEKTDITSVALIVIAHLSTFHPSIYRYLSTDPDFITSFCTWLTEGDRKGDPFSPEHPVRQLKLPYQVKAEEDSNKVATVSYVPRYSDPSRVDVLRIQPLLVEGRDTLTASAISPYFNA